VNVHVIGGSGFLGGHVVPRLLSAGHEVSALGRSTDAMARVAALGAHPLSGDLDDPASLESALRVSGADTLVSLASLGFGHAPTIVAAAEDTRIERAVFVSTTAIFTTLDAPSKPVRLAAEDAVRSSSLAWTIIRPTMIYGTPDDRNLSRLLRVVRRSPVMIAPGGGRRLQQPVHVEDLADAIVRAAERAVAIGQSYDVAGPEPLSFRRLVGEAAQAVERQVRLVSVPMGPAIALARIYERLSRRPRLTAEHLERLAEDKAFDIEPARRDLGYAPRAFAVGIEQEAHLLW
jgi:uncharacterized protein YbjT (DUF2867 family)